jgi:hypothetical protein
VCGELWYGTHVAVNFTVIHFFFIKKVGWGGGGCVKTDLFHVLCEALILFQDFLLERGELGRGGDEATLGAWWGVHFVFYEVGW